MLPVVPDTKKDLESREDVHEKVMGVLKRRGYLQPSYEIYGGLAGFYDYGPLGSRIKHNVQDLWRELFVLGEGMAEVECPTISPEQVFRASGHLEKFADTVVECPACGVGNRGDHLVRGEWKRISESAQQVIRKAAPDLWRRTANTIEAIRESAEKDPSPGNLKVLFSSKAAFFKGGYEIPGGADVVPTSTSRNTINQQNYLQPADIGVEGEENNVQVRLTGTALHVFDLRHSPPKALLDAHVQCPGCGKALDVEKATIEAFNLMFGTRIGPGRGRAGYLRPETAQGIFMDFDWAYRYFREKLPFGVVQHGRAYRNEISPRQAVLRLREFNQMEAEVFFDPADKVWPGFDALADRDLTLLRAETSEPVRMAMGKAVDDGVIANGALGYFIALTDVFLERVGVPTDVVRFRQHEPTEKAHYSTDTWDAEFHSPRFGWVEIVGIADRTDYDLKAHERVSKVKLQALRRYPEPKEVEVNRVVPVAAKLGPLFKRDAPKVAAALEALHPENVDEGAPLTVDVDGAEVQVPADAFTLEQGTERVEGEWFTPHVVEPSFGLDRILYAILETTFTEKEWSILRLPAAIAPIKAGVFPLMSKDGLDAIAREIERDLRRAGLLTQYDEGGSIGRRYARQDEIGTPFCVTVDYDTKSDGTVTIRERDSAAQKRVPRERVVAELKRLVAGETTLDEVDGAAVAG